MSDEEIPVRFELSINGKRIATGGVRHSVLDVMITRIAREPGSRPGWANKDEEFDEDDWYREEMNVSLGGMSGDDFVRWVDDAPVQVGDEILVRILGPGPVDELASSQNRDEAWREIHQPMSSDGTRETELREREADLEKAHFDLLMCLNATDEEYEQSHNRYEYVLNGLLGALIGAASEAEVNEATAFHARGEQLRTTTREFRRILLAYRTHQGTANA